MDKSWIKLYRRIKHHRIIGDGNASHVFLWILVNVHPETGEFITGRYSASRELNMKPSTFRDTLVRLSQTDHVIALTPTGNNTKISVLNWSKYQPQHRPSDDRPSETRRLPDTTKDIDKNKKQYIGNKTKLHPLLEKYFHALADAGLPDPMPYVSGDNGRFNEKTYFETLKPDHLMSFAVVKDKLQGGLL